MLLKESKEYKEYYGESDWRLGGAVFLGISSNKRTWGV